MSKPIDASGSTRVRMGLAVGVGVVALVIVGGGLVLALRAPAAPEQPIAFSHATHTGRFGIDCQYCHAGARRSAVAGVPPMATCIGCHKVVLTDHPEVEKLQGFWDREEAVAWEQVYDLAEFVRFTHEPHILSGVECSVCHGNVEQMEQVRAVGDLEMGWCVDCHTREGASNDCLTCHH